MLKQVSGKSSQMASRRNKDFEYLLRLINSDFINLGNFSHSNVFINMCESYSVRKNYATY